MRISDWSSDVCSSDLIEIVAFAGGLHMLRADTSPVKQRMTSFQQSMVNVIFQACGNTLDTMERNEGKRPPLIEGVEMVQTGVAHLLQRSEEHTSELQSLMRISYAVLCLKKKKKIISNTI